MKVGLFYNNITVLDYAYLDHNQGVIGGSLKVNIELIGTTDLEGVVFDFSYAKKKIKEIIDLECDHRLIVPKDSFKMVENEVHLELDFGVNDKTLKYICPREAICEISSSHVNKATIQVYLESILLKEMPENVESIIVELEEEERGSDFSYFNYTHGLKEHYGNCQRLFHGHRSTVEVYIAGTRSVELEKWLAHDLFSSNIHFIKTENILNIETLKKETNEATLEGRIYDHSDIEIQYTSAQGKYYGKIPCEMAYIIDEETTVENLSMHFLKVVQKKTGLKTGIMIKAFEGIAKGARSSI